MSFDYERISSAAVASANGGRINLISGLESVGPGMCVVGRAFTVEGSSGDNLALHQAVARAGRGDVIVLDVQDGRETAHCGDLIVRCAMVRQVNGIVMNGSVRDRAEIAAMGFPVFHCGTSPKPPNARVAGVFEHPVVIGGVTVRSGDLIVADDDGIVVVPRPEIDETLARIVEVETRERDVASRIDGGETTIEIFNLPYVGAPPI